MPLLIAAAIKFYQWSWVETMSLPITVFWTLMKQMRRLQAQDALQQIEILSLPHQNEEVRKAWYERQIKASGLDGDVSTSGPKLDRSGWEELKKMAQGTF